MFLFLCLFRQTQHGLHDQRPKWVGGPPVRPRRFGRCRAREGDQTHACAHASDSGVGGGDLGRKKLGIWNEQPNNYAEKSHF